MSRLSIPDKKYYMDTFERKLNKALFEGWEEFGIQDPGISSALEYTAEEISKHAPKPYGLADYDAAPVWEKLRKHPLYIQQVRSLLGDLKDQIEHLKRGKKRPFYIGDLPYSLQDIMDVGEKIAEDIGWGDARDVVIAIQRHPFAMHLLQVRDGIKRK